MFRLKCVNPCLRRLLHQGAVTRNQILERLQLSSTEDHVFDVVSKNKAKLTVDHVSCAVERLWQFQKERPEHLRTINLTKTHPQFLTLRVLARNNIALMDDLTLIDMFYTFCRLNVEPHDSLLQQIVSEAWLRIDRLPLSSLSKFAASLSNQNLQNSPLMGQITNILEQKLSSINDARVLAILMSSVSTLVSPRLRDALIGRAEQLQHTIDPSSYNTPRRMVQFLHSTKYIHRPLLEKCNEIFLCNISRLDSVNISIILGYYKALHFNNHDFRLAVKERLTELMDTSTDPFSFSRLFVSLAPIVSLEIREKLENMTLLLADEFSARHALGIVQTLEEIRSRNLSLLNKIASVIQKNLHVYNSVEVVRITKALYLLQYQNSELFATLRKILVSFLQRSFYPFEMTMLARVLSMLPCPPLDECFIPRIDEVIEQCNLSMLNSLTFAVAKWIKNNPPYRHDTHSKYVRLLQKLSHGGRERLQTADQLDLVLRELKYISGELFEDMLLEEAVVTLHRMIDQINWTNVSDLAAFLTKMNRLYPALMDRIASVAREHIDKIHFSETYDILLPFSDLNYEPAQADEFYDACIKRFTPLMSSFGPHQLVLLVHSLAVANRFPEELIREIFSIDFLGKLDRELENLPVSLNMRTRRRLMELNRAVCLECPEFQVPWFHDRYCQQTPRKGNGTISSVRQQIHEMVGEVLGGTNFVQIAVTTPYFYTVDFECKLDTHLQPLSYYEPNTLQISDRGKVPWNLSSPENTREELPPGAQRVAVDFINSSSFCKNSHHIKGDALMRKRHLEILGYRVVQIPHFEWNSMELSTHSAWKEYLRKKLFG